GGGRGAFVAQEEASRPAQRAEQSEPLNVYTEYLNLPQLNFAERFPEETLAYLRAKYAIAGLDVIALTNSRTLRFVLKHRARLFPGVPIVFSAVSKASAGNPKLDDDVTGVWLMMDWPATLDAALRLQPHTDHVVVVTGGSGVDHVWSDTARAQLS